MEIEGPDLPARCGELGNANHSFQRRRLAGAGLCDRHALGVGTTQSGEAGIADREGGLKVPSWCPSHQNAHLATPAGALFRWGLGGCLQGVIGGTDASGIGYE